MTVFEQSCLSFLRTRSFFFKMLIGAFCFTFTLPFFFFFFGRHEVDVSHCLFELAWYGLITG